MIKPACCSGSHMKGMNSTSQSKPSAPFPSNSYSLDNYRPVHRRRYLLQSHQPKMNPYKTVIRNEPMDPHDRSRLDNKLSEQIPSVSTTESAS
uniref:Uncharacterized protein n=1 Tax=Parascaris equorum TaxID=6256 RepID=A0A914S3T8_PAREQ